MENNIEKCKKRQICAKENPPLFIAATNKKQNQ
jgi:hypothetical protein